jgi:hypothetical protein
MAFSEPDIHRVADIEAHARSIPATENSGGFSVLTITFRQADNERAEMKVFFMEGSSSRAHEIADAINRVSSLQQAEE